MDTTMSRIFGKENEPHFGQLDDDVIPSIILDNGSGLVKAGLCGEAGPRAVFPTIVGTPKHTVSLKKKLKHCTKYCEE